ncbi:8-oxo-dGTP pyrophosphatase MutT, NUDIX family [Pustulibacterium marinum]|uniref:8-oxo-dGTP pyrophosphatase MutT, NUDIX family n=2 Tax=Pustulibacterium marinum TaxID=1224947 RepID=A0A1I7H473_9FLAO|nr:8-oxo-dGTP pyrophosphatase MutT, NUDIX family [Pustulibacterium marinum]
MTPEERIQQVAKIDFSKKKVRQAGVLSLFYPDAEEETKLLLTLRHAYEGVHSNQISFPGGKKEKEDENLKITALRETEEEVGVRPTEISVIRPLSEVYIPPSNFLVQPFLGYTLTSPMFKIQEKEVAALVEVDFEDFLDDARLFAAKMKTSYAESIEVPAFNFNDFTVWGATAMMLSEVKELFKGIL